nr:hypothetical protein [Pseudoclavibacter chungangensis]
MHDLRTGRPETRRLPLDLDGIAEVHDPVDPERGEGDESGVVESRQGVRAVQASRGDDAAARGQTAEIAQVVRPGDRDGNLVRCSSHAL